MEFFSLLEIRFQVMMLTNAVVIGCPNLIAHNNKDVKTITLSIGALLTLLDVIGCPNLIAHNNKDVKTITLSIGALLTLLDLYERRYLVLDEGFS
jgi:hypothetical protein